MKKLPLVQDPNRKKLEPDGGSKKHFVNQPKHHRPIYYHKIFEMCNSYRDSQHESSSNKDSSNCLR